MYPACLQASGDGVLLRIRVQPRASRNRLEGVRGDQLRIRLTAPPVDGAANAACIALLAKSLGVRRAQVRIAAGEKSHDKLIHVLDLTPDEVAAKII